MRSITNDAPPDSELKWIFEISLPIQLPKILLFCSNYPNRRIGDFLKEQGLTEGRSTGIPKMIRAGKSNGSPAS